MTYFGGHAVTSLQLLYFELSSMILPKESHFVSDNREHLGGSITKHSQCPQKFNRSNRCSKERSATSFLIFMHLLFLADVYHVPSTKEKLQVPMKGISNLYLFAMERNH